MKPSLFSRILSITFCCLIFNNYANGQCSPDVTPPNAVCQNATVQLDGTGNATLDPAQVDNGSSDFCDPTPSLSVSPNTFTCANLASPNPITVTLTVTDAAGNPATCTASVTTEDNAPPTAVCQNTTVQLDQSGNGTIAAVDIDGGSSTACGGFSRSASQTAFTCADIPNVSVTLTITDNSNSQTATCNATVTVEDNAPPVAVCQDITIALDAAGEGTANATDLDGGSSTACGTLSLSLTPNPFECANVGTPPAPPVNVMCFDCNDIGTHTVNLTVTDDSNGQTDNCNATVTVEDNIAPTAVCQDVTLQIGITGSATLDPAQVDNGSSDNCTNPPNLSVSPNTFTCSNIPTPVTVTLTVTDDSSNPATCSALVSFAEGPPEAVCQDFTVQLDANGNGNMTAANIDGGSDTPCGGFSRSASQTSFTCADLPSVVVTLTITDNNTNQTDNCTATVTVEDNIAPTAICPASIADVELDATGNGTLPANIGDGSSTDNCATPTETSPSQAYTCAEIGVQTVVLTADDGNGNTDTETCSFNVVDNEAPVAVCPASIPDVELDAAGNGTLPANIGDGSSTDNCSTLTETSPSQSYTCADIGVQTVVLTADDGNGNTDTETCSFNVVDNIDPVAICPASIADVELDANGNGVLPANIGDGSSTDNCSTPTETSPSQSYTCADVGVQTVVLTADDGNGNTDTETCSFNVVDNIDPVITCPANVTRECDQSTTSIWTGVATATDNCTPVANIVITESDVTTPGACLNEWTITRTWTADAGGGATASCDQIITVVDSKGPAITCPANVTVECDQSTAPANTGNATAVDNCDTQPTITSSDVTAAGGCANEWTITRTWTATDNCGNSSNCDQIITVEDSSAPTIACPNDVTVECDTDNSSASTGIATATDNCSAVGDIVISESDATTPGACANEWTITRTWTATDECGNPSSCDQIINVEDSQGPTITCPANTTVECDEDHSSANTGVATATDNCSAAGAITITESDATTPGNCPNAWTITRTWTATDECGQPSSCDQTIDVVDTTAPIMVCGSLTVTPNTDGTYSLTQAEIDGLGAGSTDNCGSVTFTAAPSSFTCADEGPNSVTITGTDDCGNNASCTATVTVEAYLTIVSCTAKDESCAGAGDGSIEIVATALGGQVMYSIDGGANFTANGTFINLTPGTYNIVVKVFGINEVCEKTDTKTVATGGTSQACYYDGDGDGYGATNVAPVTACNCPTGYYTSAELNGNTANDCNDTNPAINPGATEVCDGLDNDCDGILMAGEIDADGDGYMVCDGDCDDANAAIYPGATEICDGLDNDCDGDIDEGVSSDQTYVGNVTFQTQAELDAWLACYSIIDGNLTIVGVDITNLGPLSNLVEVTGNISIYYNAVLTSLNGLENLTTVGGSLSIFYNFLLADCCAIDDLLTNGGVAGTVSIFFNAYGSHCNSEAEIMTACPLSPLVSNPNQNSLNNIETTDAMRNKHMILYPNPASREVTVVMERTAPTAKLVVLDMLGRVVFKQNLGEDEIKVIIDLDANGFQSGIYVVTLFEEGKLQTKQLVVE